MFAGDERPSLKYLNRYVKQPVGSRWYDLGIELLEADDIEVLDKINSDNPKDHDRCCTVMFQLWLRKQPTASWNQLIESLKQPGIELTQLAIKIEQMLLLPKPSSNLMIINYHVVNGCLHSLDWTTGTELFSFFGQVCVYFSANLEAFFKKLLLYSCHTLHRVIRMILITELPYCSSYIFTEILLAKYIHNYICCNVMFTDKNVQCKFTYKHSCTYIATCISTFSFP